MLHIWSDNGKCFIAEWNGLPRRNEMKTGAASSEKANIWSAPAVHEARLRRMKRTCGAWNTAAPYEAALRAMKRNLFRLHVFARWAKNGRPFLLNSEFSPKLKWVQVNQSWLSLRYLSKISLFLTFYSAEKNFQLKQKDFFSETNAKCLEKQLNLRLLFWK